MKRMDLQLQHILVDYLPLCNEQWIQVYVLMLIHRNSYSILSYHFGDVLSDRLIHNFFLYIVTSKFVVGSERKTSVAITKWFCEQVSCNSATCLSKYRLELYAKRIEVSYLFSVIGLFIDLRLIEYKIKDNFHLGCFIIL